MLVFKRRTVFKPLKRLLVFNGEQYLSLCLKGCMRFNGGQYFILYKVCLCFNGGQYFILYKGCLCLTEDNTWAFIKDASVLTEDNILSFIKDACVSTEDDFEDLDEEVDEQSVDEPQGRLRRLIELLDGLFDRLLRRIFRKYSPTIVNMYIYNNTLGKQRTWLIQLFEFGSTKSQKKNRYEIKTQNFKRLSCPAKNKTPCCQVRYPSFLRPDYSSSLHYKYLFQLYR